MKKNPAVLVLSVFTFFFFVVIAVAALTLTGGKSDSAGSGDKNPFATSKNTRIGVVDISGVIMDSKKTMERIDQFVEDKKIKGIIARINSPGGAVAPSQEIYDALKRAAAKKPVYSSMSSMAASGGYYVACGTQKIFADAGTLTGSIGVIMQFMDASKLYQWAKVSPYNVKTGKFKDIGAADREMTVDEKALLQELIDNVLSQFRRAVMDARKLTLDQVIPLSDGRIFSGEQAKNHKLVDELGGLYDAAEAMHRELKGTGKAVLVYPRKQHRMLIEKLFDDGDDQDGLTEESSFAGRLARAAAQLTGNPGNAISSVVPAGFTQPGLMFLMPLGR